MFILSRLEDITSTEARIPDCLKPIPQIMKLHQITGSRKNSLIDLRKLTCIESRLQVDCKNFRLPISSFKNDAELSKRSPKNKLLI